MQPRKIEKAFEVRAMLDQVNHNIDLWAESLGYELRRSPRMLRRGAKSVLLKTLFGDIIGIKTGMSHKEEVASIAHEICHDLFHASCIAYRVLREVEINKDEAEAETFASLVVFPSLTDYETADEFRRTCGTSSTLAEQRLKFFERHGW
jgi:Zn-dependent peptidase ImmA (M78 family)